MTSLPAGQFLDLHETDFLLNKPSFSVIADLISRRASIALCEVIDTRQERSNEVSRKLRRIARTARFITDERGTEDLYVGWPFVRGKFLDSTVVHGPLLFFPVQIEQQGKFWKLTRRSEELAFLNPTLVLAYGQFNQVKLPDELVEKPIDDFDRDPLSFRTQLYEWLKTSLLEINFNQNLFTDRLQFFDKQTAKSLSQLERTGELKLFPEAVLGIFPQAGSFLVPDYDVLIQQAQDRQTEGLENSLLPDANLPTESSPIPERFIHTPLPMDASQERVLRAVKSGMSLVVQGPPGTGKSQLIANLMADAAAGGKRVLLVCQKRAALDVVQARLRQVGMAPFMAVIHDVQDDRRALYQQIAGQVEQIEHYRQQSNGLNAVLLERDFDLESQRIDEAISNLQAFKKALFDLSLCGVSVKELYLTSTPNSPTIALDDIYPQFPINNVDNFVRRLNNYAAYRERLSSTYPWADRVSFARLASLDVIKVDQAIAQWQAATQTLARQAHILIGKSLSVTELANWQAHIQDLSTLLTVLEVSGTVTFWPVINELRHNPAHPAFQIEETQFDSLLQRWQQALAEPGPAVTSSPDRLPEFQAVLTDAQIARSSWFRWNWWLLTSPDKTELQQMASANGLTLSKSDIQTLAIRVANRIELETILSSIQSLLAGLTLQPIPASLQYLRQAVHFVKQLNRLPVLQQLPVSAWQTSTSFTETVSGLLSTVEETETQRVLVRTYLLDEQLDQIWQNESYVTTLRQALRRDFDLLVEADRLSEEFSSVEKTVIERLADTSPAIWAATFQNTLRLAWLSHIEHHYPELRNVSTLKMQQIEQTLQESLQHKQVLSRDILLVKLREQTYRNLTLNRLNNVVTYRDLLHQTTKKRNIWPVRKLMELYADEVFKLIPCWLASPESVSAMFPLREDLFDLVIFDEASQCFAENGVPAIIRGRQIVVTGDNQQLRPSDLYRVQLEEPESDEEPVPAALEVESLLELAAQQLPQVSLTEHYRSRSLDLITFSNEHFYQNRLQLLPYFDDINRHEPAIRYVNVKGTWQHNTNPTEAETVVRLLDQLATELPGRSFGVVTFNYPQQQLIQEMLESAAVMQTAPEVGPTHQIREELFVKNIENVQGDERDVIIFSVGYAPDERGRLTMQFGSLNARGGENRLNVAVTRARERVYVVTSLWPDQLTVGDMANKGPKLLKSYLNYALDVAQERFRPRPRLTNKSGIGLLLKDRLAAQYPDWMPELPFADLTIKTDAHYDGLVLTDDDAYYQQAIKEAHAYLPIALQSRHWPFRREWSRNFWQV
ncbi:DUF4011 domain-containing protein [Spirosoma taeanense]|uniref:DUF4011 domain-containing protein n=1 Tax=Spirosoma taeanense TaxID=2735870 RepID=A0A6M5YDS4_9BACT|nr:DUF4011 domain-containing protein [Spirosoma taeanense]